MHLSVMVPTGMQGTVCVCVCKWLLHSKCSISAYGINRQTYGNWTGAGVPGCGPTSCILWMPVCLSVHLPLVCSPLLVAEVKPVNRRLYSPECGGERDPCRRTPEAQPLARVWRWYVCPELWVSGKGTGFGAGPNPDLKALCSSHWASGFPSTTLGSLGH